MIIGNIELTWLGHASFLIKDKKTIYIDPYKLKQTEKTDIILLTHSHYDHCSIEDLRKIVKDGTIIVCPADCQSKINKLDVKIKTLILEPGQEIYIEKIKIKAFPAYNVNKHFHGKGEYWNGYIIEIDGKKIYHAGDTDFIPEMAGLEEQKIDVALLPVSGVYTMNADEASRAAFIIKPKIAVPMHYGEFAGTNEDALRFMDLCESEGLSCKILEKD